MYTFFIHPDFGRLIAPVRFHGIQLGAPVGIREEEDRMANAISFQLNGKPVKVDTSGDRMLLWVLRTDLGLTGTKYGCGESLCGACTVLVDKKAVRSCVLPLKEVQGKEVITIEGLSSDGRLHPLQKAFMQFDALQCGYCTPGMILNACSLLLKNPRPTRAEIIQEMEGNLCRCGAHTRILQAIEAAVQEMK
jgi:aerobic-type carbon monoxide dehydrogenase small subunit (CoxS/CutS family)